MAEVGTCGRAPRKSPDENVETSIVAMAGETSCGREERTEGTLSSSSSSMEVEDRDSSSGRLSTTGVGEIALDSAATATCAFFTRSDSRSVPEG